MIYSWYGQMFPGQMLPGQRSLWYLASVIDGTRNLTLTFGQNRVSNSWDIPDMDKCCLDKCQCDSWNLFKRVPGTYLVKIGPLTGKILPTLISWWVVVVYSHFRVKPKLNIERLSWGWVWVLTTKNDKQKMWRKNQKWKTKIQEQKIKIKIENKNQNTIIIKKIKMNSAKIGILKNIYVLTSLKVNSALFNISQSL